MGQADIDYFYIYSYFLCHGKFKPHLVDLEILPFERGYVFQEVLLNYKEIY